MTEQYVAVYTVDINTTKFSPDGNVQTATKIASNDLMIMHISDPSCIQQKELEN